MYMYKADAKKLYCHRDKKSCITDECMAWQWTGGKKIQTSRITGRIRDVGDPEKWDPCQEPWKLKEKMKNKDEITAVCEMQSTGHCGDLK